MIIIPVPMSQPDTTNWPDWTVGLYMIGLILLIIALVVVMVASFRK